MPEIDLTAVTVLSVIGLTAVCIAVPWIIIAYWQGYRKQQLATELVRDMMAQGMGAADIEKILMVWSADAESVAKVYRRRCKDEDQQLKGLPPKAKNIPMKPPIAG
jgi:hypothetical protein